MTRSNETLTINAIGGYAEPIKSHEPTTLSIGEKFLSVKQLISKYTPLLFNSPVVTANYQNIYPYSMQLFSTAKADNTVIYPTYFGDLVSEISSGFALYRGGMRITMVSLAAAGAANSTPFHVGLSTNTIIDGTAAVQAGGAITNSNRVASAPFTTNSWNTQKQYGSLSISDAYVGNAELKVPYYCKTKASWVRNMAVFPGVDALINPYPYVDQPITNLGVVNQYSVSFNYYRAADEDFQFGYFIGFAPVRY